MAFELLQQLHEQKVNLTNMNIKHPLFPLLLMVEPETYFAYLMGLCSVEKGDMEVEGVVEDENILTHFNELDVFVAVINKNLKVESLAKAVELLVTQYHNKKNEKHLQALSRLFNSLLPEVHKKKQQILSKQSQILSKLNFANIEIG